MVFGNFWCDRDLQHVAERDDADRIDDRHQPLVGRQALTLNDRAVC